MFDFVGRITKKNVKVVCESEGNLMAEGRAEGRLVIPSTLIKKNRGFELEWGLVTFG